MVNPAHFETRPFSMPMKFPLAVALLLLPAIAEAADITGIAKVREGDTVQIGSSRIRLGGIDAPSVDQLCLNNTGARWACQTEKTCRQQALPLPRPTDRPSWPPGCALRGRRRGHPEMDGEERLG